MLGIAQLNKVIDTGCEVINMPGRKHIAGDQGVKPSGPCGDIRALVMGVYVPYSVVAVLNDLAVPLRGHDAIVPIEVIMVRS